MIEGIVPEFLSQLYANYSISEKSSLWKVLYIIILLYIIGFNNILWRPTTNPQPSHPKVWRVATHLTPRIDAICNLIRI